VTNAAFQWWLGPPGRMQRLRAPRRDYARGADAGATTYNLSSGGSAVDRAAVLDHKLAYQWNWLSQAEWGVLQGLYSGQFGPGPHTVLDGATANYLSPAQASGGTAGRDSSGFVPAGVLETVSLATTPTDVGDRAVAWQVPAHPTGVLRLVAPSQLSRTYLSTPPSLTWWCWVRMRATAAIPAHLRLSWRDATGAQISAVDAADTTLSTTSWGAFPVLGTAPPTAVFMEPQVVLASGSIGAPTTVYLGSARLGLGNFDATWMPGEGMQLVALTGLSESVPIGDRRTCTLTLQEVSG
jgi:hypothetical protein